MLVALPMMDRKKLAKFHVADEEGRDASIIFSNIKSTASLEGAQISNLGFTFEEAVDDDDDNDV